MAKRMFEFVCDDGHITERLISDDVRESECRECGKPATRIMSKPMVKLEGVTGDFPGAYYSWERKRAEKLAADRKRTEAE